MMRRTAYWAAKRAAKSAVRRNRGRLIATAAGVSAGIAGLALLRRARMADLRGEVAVITGSSRGLGFLLAREFGRQGCRLVICARDAGELERARQELASQGFDVLAVPCDITDAGQVRTMMDRARSRFGRIDILVNNAGVIQVGPIQSMRVEDFDEALNVMFWGVLHPTLAVLPEMLERKSGRIVNITSIGGKISVPHLVPYNCAKFAAVGLSEGLRAELKQDGIRVTTICPGLMRTGSFLNAYFKGRQEREYRWFGLGATMPLVSMDAERAARQIVAATRRGSAERILSLPATMAARFHGLFPGLTAELLSWANRLALPAASGEEAGRSRGMEVHERTRSSMLGALFRMGFSAAERFNEYPGPRAA